MVFVQSPTTGSGKVTGNFDIRFVFYLGRNIQHTMTSEVPGGGILWGSPEIEM